ncbi:MAG: YggS family pyridoxal phosphate-dependent enzyme [Oscillospiraceae bacterium]|nr:YggS family pyridoxal phosphate-dependent enzyme [Oscillospiraceae bacterium]
MSQLEERIAAVREQIAAAARAAGRDPSEILLVAATKTRSDETIRQAVAAGITACGENRVQELLPHLEAGAYGDAQVHFIGHLQRNKVRQVVGRVDLIQSVDSEELLRLIDLQAAKLGIVQDILLEVNIAGEASKSGVAPEQAMELALKTAAYPAVRLRGLMCIPPVSEISGKNRVFFAEMRHIFVDIMKKTGDNRGINWLSMGMSDDFTDAIAEGANLVRIGTALFGPRG